jgi:hypothetical protein
MKLEWKEPPQARHRESVINAALIAALRARKGKWIQLRGPRRSNYGSEVSRWGKRFPVLEIVSRTEADGCYLYVRYVGNGKRESR